MKLDVVGDIHGHLEALNALGRTLGYDTDGDWSHPDGRLLVLVGDLVDRGAKSLETSELVRRLVSKRRALCLMGNHEYNLVRWNHGTSKPKHSNRRTIADIEVRRARWEPVLEWFESLPIALELPELRVIHAVWHLECVEQVRGALGASAIREACADDYDDLCGGIALTSPFSGRALHRGLPTDNWPDNEDRAHEILIKGYEHAAAASFTDSDGKERSVVRAVWWNDAAAPVAHDRRTVFGHYWNVPPANGKMHAAPPHPSGHPELASWQREMAERVPDRGFVDLPADKTFVCVDYNGVFNAGAGSCVGAYRWPEHQVAWARVRGQ